MLHTVVAAQSVAHFQSLADFVILCFRIFECAKSKQHGDLIVESPLYLAIVFG